MKLLDADKLKNAIDKSTCNYAEIMWKQVVKDIIDNQQTVSQWIPCSERLPKENEPVLGTVEVEDELMVMELIFYNDWLKGKYELIAWQPLPQPYKESELNGNSCK